LLPQIIHTQVRVAADAGGFKGDDLCALLVVILNALKEYVAEHHSKLHRQRALDEPVLGAVQLCAVVNDYERLYDKATELRDALLGKGQLDPEKHFDVLDHVLDQLHDEQARVSFEATRLVAYLVLRDASASLLDASPFDDPSAPPLPAAASWAAWDHLPGLGGNGGTAAAAAAAAALVEKAKAQQRQKEAVQRLAGVDVLKDARLTIKVGGCVGWMGGCVPINHSIKQSIEANQNNRSHRTASSPHRTTSGTWPSGFPTTSSRTSCAPAWRASSSSTSPPSSGAARSLATSSACTTGCGRTSRR
jgi:hypothetical protein